MAIAFDAAPVAAGGGGGGTSLSWTHTTGSGSNRILWSGLLIARNSTGSAPTSATYNGTAMTILANTVFATGTGDIYLAYQVAPASGANTLTWNFSGTGNLGTTGFSTSYTGAAQSSVPDSVNTATAASGASFSPSTTVVASNCWLESIIVQDNGGISITAPATNRVNNGSQVFADTNGTVGTGSQSITATGPSAHWGAVIVSFAPFVASTSSIKTWDGVAQASVKNFLGVANASTKTWDGVANV